MRASLRRLDDGWKGARKTIPLRGVGQRRTISATRVVARLVTLMVRCPTPVLGTVGWTLTRMRRESRARGRASERGGSGVAVGLTAGLTVPMVGVPEADDDDVAVGV